MWRLNLFPVANLGHSSNSSTPQAGVLVAVPPAVYCTLDQTPLSSQAWIELRERPSYSVALGLVVQAVAFVLVLIAASAGIHAVFLLKILGKLLDVDRLDVAPDGVFHLNSVARVLESNPLDAILVLPYNEWGGGRNGAWRSVRINVRVAWSSWMHVWRTDGRRLRGCLWRAESRWRALKLRSLRHARFGTSSHHWRVRMRLVLWVHLLALLVGHQQRIGRHRLLLLR